MTKLSNWRSFVFSEWRHNESDGVSNHRRVDSLLNHLFGRRSKKTSPVNSPNKGPETRKLFPCDNVIRILKYILLVHIICGLSWWHHQMETFSTLLALCAGNSPVTGEFPAQRPATRSFDVRLNNDWVNNRHAGDLRYHRAHYDVTVIWSWLSFHPRLDVVRRRGSRTSWMWLVLTPTCIPSLQPLSQPEVPTLAYGKSKTPTYVGPWLYCI